MHETSDIQNCIRITDFHGSVDEYATIQLIIIVSKLCYTHILFFPSKADKYACLCYEPKTTDQIAVKLPDKWKDSSRRLEEYELRQIHVRRESTNQFVFIKWYTGE